MARPSTPLIIREKVLDEALDLIDDVGFDSFSLPQLAKRLGIRTPSLYHHFANRTELLAEVAKSVVDRFEPPAFDESTQTWREWCVAMAVAMRDMILARPKAAPLMMWYLTTAGVPHLREYCSAFLQSRGLSATESAFVVYSMERMTLGSAGSAAAGTEPPRPICDGDPAPGPDPSGLRGLSARELFERTLHAFLVGVTVQSEQTT